MKTGRLVAALVGAVSLASPAPGAAQEPVTFLAQLAGELKPGDTVWVTDAQGREIKGEIGALEPGMGAGALIGVGIDAMIPGKQVVVYRAPGSNGASHARLSMAPVITPRARGVAVAFAF